MGPRNIDYFHGKHVFINRKLWTKYMKVTGKRLTYDEFKDIILETIKEIRTWVLKQPIGYQLSPKLGNISINKFKPGSDFKSYIHTSEGSFKNHNLHTYGNVYRIQWFHATDKAMTRQPFWYFKACRSFKRSLASVLKGKKAPIYNCYMQNQFITRSNG